MPFGSLGIDDDPFSGLDLGDMNDFDFDSFLNNDDAGGLAFDAKLAFPDDLDPNFEYTDDKKELDKSKEVG